MGVWGLCPQTPIIGSRSVLAYIVPHCSEEIAATDAHRPYIVETLLKHTAAVYIVGYSRVE